MPNHTPRVAMVAGETSGDLLAGLLLDGLQDLWPGLPSGGIGGAQMAQRGFEAAKVQLESELALLNAQVAIFNARQSAYQTAANVHKIALEERALELEKFKAELEAEIAKGQINEQRVKVFLGLYDRRDLYAVVAVDGKPYQCPRYPHR